MARIDAASAAERLKAADAVWILAHANPDGDTLGSAYALCGALAALGKRAAVLSPDPLPELYRFLAPNGCEPPAFTPGFIVAVDVAAPDLLGRFREPELRVDLCVDHHGSNTDYARETCLDPSAGAAGELVFDLIDALGVPVSGEIADALYLALSSDTGGFRYAGTTAETHRKAARLMEAGARSEAINRLLFESKPRALASLEARLTADMAYHFGGLCAAIRLPLALLAEFGLTEAETDGVSALPRKILGVEVGLTLRERADGACRASIRTAGVGAGDLAARFGGGGHRYAAGCTLRGPMAEAEARLVEAAGDALKAAGLLQ